MADPARVLVVAHQTAATEPLLDAVKERAARGPATFHLVVPRQPHGLAKVLDPEEYGEEEARRVLADALPKLSAVVGHEVTGSIGDSEPLAAIQDAINIHGFDELIISTLPTRVSRWLKLDLPSKAAGLGLPVTTVTATGREAAAVT
jgi:hypothetical protein